MHVDEEVPRAEDVACSAVVVVCQSFDGFVVEVVGHEGLGVEVLVVIVNFRLGERAVGEGGQGRDPSLNGHCARIRSDAELGEKWVHELVVLGAVAIVDTSQLVSADKNTHVELGWLSVDGEVLKSTQNASKLGRVCRVDVVLKYYVGFWCVESLEGEVGDDTKCCTRSTQGPEEVSVLASRSSYNRAIGQDNVCRDQLVEGETLHARDQTIATMESEPSDAHTAVR